MVNGAEFGGGAVDVVRRGVKIWVRFGEMGICECFNVARYAQKCYFCFVKLQKHEK